MNQANSPTKLEAHCRCGQHITVVILGDNAEDQQSQLHDVLGKQGWVKAPTARRLTEAGEWVPAPHPHDLHVCSQACAEATLASWDATRTTRYAMWLRMHNVDPSDIAGTWEAIEKLDDQKRIIASRCVAWLTDHPEAK